MLKVVLGPYYWKHRIYIEDKESLDEFEKLRECKPLRVYIDCLYTMFQYGDDARQGRMFRIWILFGIEQMGVCVSSSCLRLRKASLMRSR